MGIDKIISEASKLPLYDAAYFLVSRRRILPREEQKYIEGILDRLGEGVTPRPRPAKDMSLIQWVQISMGHERSGALNTPVLYLLKRSHSNASDFELKTAAKAAFKLESDCLKYFPDEYSNYYESLDRAVELAKAENPQFQDQTYKRAWDDLASTLR